MDGSDGVTELQASKWLKGYILCYVYSATVSKKKKSVQTKQNLSLHPRAVGRDRGGTVSVRLFCGSNCVQSKRAETGGWARVRRDCRALGIF